mmetsp:Transcript_25110/g.59656  ORF Transcript_25110/g.59656 Transcript_25110/m.59656 type:complete len:184 (-) Transcript_25110:523-1074(-)
MEDVSCGRGDEFSQASLVVVVFVFGIVLGRQRSRPSWFLMMLHWLSAIMCGTSIEITVLMVGIDHCHWDIIYSIGDKLWFDFVCLDNSRDVFSIEKKTSVFVCDAVRLVWFLSRCARDIVFLFACLLHCYAMLIVFFEATVIGFCSVDFVCFFSLLNRSRNTNSSSEPIALRVKNKIESPQKR